MPRRLRARREAAGSARVPLGPEACRRSRFAITRGCDGDTCRAGAAPTLDRPFADGGRQLVGGRAPCRRRGAPGRRLVTRVRRAGTTLARSRAMRTQVLASLSFVVALAPAQTFVVDASGAGDYTSIVSAIAAVPSGSTLRVRAGSYAPFTIAGKSLKVLCDAGAEAFHPFGGGFGVTGLGPGQSVVVQGLRLRANWAFPLNVSCTSCQGSVLLDGLIPSSPDHARIQATDCAQLLIRGLSPATAWRLCTLTNCNTVLESLGLAAGWVTAPLVQIGGTLQVVRCSVAGGAPYMSQPGGAIHLSQGASLRLLAGTSLLCLGGSCVQGAGTARYDPTVSFASPPNSNPPFDPTVVATAEPMPALTTSYANGIASASLTGVPGHLGVVGVALPGPLLLVPGIDDAVWVDAAGFIPVAFGVVGTGAPVTAQLPWSGGPTPAVRAVWQALTFAPAGTLHLSNPSFTLLP
jgi:hypothetical protein